MRESSLPRHLGPVMAIDPAVGSTEIRIAWGASNSYFPGREKINI